MSLTRAVSRSAFIAIALVAQLSAQAGGPQISVGPNILVSREADIAHVELTVAANPKQRQNLIGGAISGSRPIGGWTSKAYVTQDGGYLWTTVTMPGQVFVDPQVAFAPDGTAYFLALGAIKDKEGKARMGLAFYTSRDAGVTWSGPTGGAGVGADHPQIVVDQTNSKNAGRVYIAYLGGTGQFIISVIGSEDQGKSFSAPVSAAENAGKDVGINVNTPLVLSDGTLIVPYAEFSMHAHDVEHPVTFAKTSFYVVASSDGGTTFSPAVKVEDRHTSIEQRVTTFPVFAVDGTAGKFRDRIYVAWTDWRSGGGRILFSSSSDKGQSWSRAVAIDAAAPPESLQYQPTIAVNSDGVVGVRWFDTRHSSDIDHYDEYFTASVDGGASFLKAVRVSTASSAMLGSGNLRPAPQMAMRMAGAIHVPLASPANRWRQGGEYMGMTADADGVFHPFWSDARSGTSQVWTARISIGNDPANLRVAPGAQPTDVTGQVAVVFDPATYDVSAAELRLPARLRNVSTQPIAPPLTLTIREFGSGMGEELREFAPEVLNASNNEKGAGAVFDYSGALGSLTALAPGAQTEAIVWRLRFPNPLQIPNLQLQVSGRAEPVTPPAAKQCRSRLSRKSRR